MWSNIETYSIVVTVFYAQATYNDLQKDHEQYLLPGQ